MFENESIVVFVEWIGVRTMFLNLLKQVHLSLNQHFKSVKNTTNFSFFSLKKNTTFAKNLHIRNKKIPTFLGLGSDLFYEIFNNRSLF
jgi:hypothetical protein